MSTTTGSIMDILAAITYSTSSYTVEQRFQLHERSFEEFNKFPLFVIEDGDEEDINHAGNIVTITYRPTIVFYAEGQTATQMKAWRDDARDAIYESAALDAITNQVTIDSIEIAEENERKLQTMEIALTILFDKEYTLS